MTQRLTDTTVRALRLLRDVRIDSARQFARLMWPDADGWTTHTKCGAYGTTHGGGMNLAGGAYLGRLKSRGLVDGYGGGRSQFSLTAEGEAALRAYEEAASR
jgi:hypothetical protein